MTRRSAAPRRTGRRMVRGTAAALGLGLGLTAMVPLGAGANELPIDVQVLAVTDLHGYLSPATDAANSTIVTADGSTLTVGGAAYLAAQLDRVSQGQSNSIRVANGDSFTGWQWQVTMTRDEPTIEVMNDLGFEVSAVGNHELDISESFLADHMRDGGCFDEPGTSSCFPQSDGSPFSGAGFPFLAANLFREDGSRPFPASFVREVAGADGATARVGFIGVTTPGVERIFASYQVGSLVATDMRSAIDAEAARLAGEGVNTIVVLAHEGGSTSGTFEQCAGVAGPVVDLAAQASPLVDAIVGGHWHTAFSCDLPDPEGTLRPVISPGHHGRLFADLRLQIDPATGDVVPGSVAAQNVPVTRDITVDPGVAQTVNHWNAVGGALWARPYGEVSGDVTMTPDDSGESSMKNLVADAYRDIGTDAAGQEADLALAEPYQVRGAITHAAGTNPADVPGRVLFGEAWASHGRGSSVVAGWLTGTQLREALEQQWRTDAGGVESYVPLGLSGVRVVANPTEAIGERIKSVWVGSSPLRPHERYLVAMSSRLALGMDGFTALTDPETPMRSDMDYFAFTSWWVDAGVVSPPATDRVSFICGPAWSGGGWPAKPPTVPGQPCS
jgi:5'-nucleotidase